MESPSKGPPRRPAKLIIGCGLTVVVGVAIAAGVGAAIAAFCACVFFLGMAAAMRPADQQPP